MWAAISKMTGVVYCEGEIRKDVRMWCEAVGIPRNAYTLKRVQAYGAR